MEFTLSREPKNAVFAALPVAPDRSQKSRRKLSQSTKVYKELTSVDFYKDRFSGDFEGAV